VVASEREQRQLIKRGLRLVRGMARSHPLPFAISLAGSVTMAVGTVLATVTLGWLTDDVVLPAFEDSVARRSTVTVVLAVLLVAAVRSAGVVVRRFFAGMTVFLCKSDLQSDLGRHYLAMPPEELRAASKGKLLAHADSDVDVATDALSPFPFTLGVVTLLVASTVSLALMDWVLMAVALPSCRLLLASTR